MLFVSKQEVNLRLVLTHHSPLMGENDPDPANDPTNAVLLCSLLPRIKLLNKSF